MARARTADRYSPRQREIGQSGAVTEVQPDENSTEPCPVCGHAENVHAHWRADAICDGWAHCKVGSEATGDACQCWREWPKLEQPIDA